MTESQEAIEQNLKSMESQQLFDACQKCHRHLKKLESMRRGYGNICWKKVPHNDQKPPQEENMMEEIDLPLTLAEMIYDQLETKFCIWCPDGTQSPFAPEDLYAYPHNGGMHLPGFEGLYWVYVHCSHCGHDESVWKLGVVELPPIKTVEEFLQPPYDTAVIQQLQENLGGVFEVPSKDSII